MLTESSLEPGWLNKQFSSVRKTVEEYPEWLKKGLGMNEGTRLLTDEELTRLLQDVLKERDELKERVAHLEKLLCKALSEDEVMLDDDIGC